MELLQYLGLHVHLSHYHGATHTSQTQRCPKMPRLALCPKWPTQYWDPDGPCGAAAHLPWLVLTVATFIRNLPLVRHVPSGKRVGRGRRLLHMQQGRICQRQQHGSLQGGGWSRGTTYMCAWAAADDGIRDVTAYRGGSRCLTPPTHRVETQYSRTARLAHVSNILRVQTRP